MPGPLTAPTRGFWSAALAALTDKPGKKSPSAEIHERRLS